MRRHTPIVAIVLAPVALYALAILWQHALIPVYRSIWHADNTLQIRLASGEPAMRISALKDVPAARPLDAQLAHKIATLVGTDANPEVRKSAAGALGRVGAQQPLSAPALRALSELVLSAEDEGLLGAGLVALGQSASNNHHPDRVVERVAAILVAKHFSWLYPQVAQALGQIGAAQALPGPVYDVMNAVFTNPERPGERENLARAFAAIAKGRALPEATVDLLIMALAQEDNARVRAQIIYALARGATDHPETKSLITAATEDAQRDVRSAAEHALRIMEGERTFGQREPMAVARDRSAPVATRLKALQIIAGRGLDAADYTDIIALARDDDSQMRAAALGLFHYLARSPHDDFDRDTLIPALIHAMGDPDPEVREAAVGALSTISVHRPRYPHADQVLSARLAASTEDPAPRVRVVALVAMLRAAAGCCG